MNRKITYKKNKMYFLKKNKNATHIHLTLKLQKKKLYYAIQNIVFFLFSFSSEFNLLKIKKYIKYKSLNTFNFILIKNLLDFPFFRYIFKSENEYFYMKYNFKIYLNFVFNNNNYKDNFYNNLNLLKILRFPIQRL
jgi:hypothetical protein